MVYYFINKKLGGRVFFVYKICFVKNKRYLCGVLKNVLIYSLSI